ncbi:MAG: beta-lactamase family protein [Candidatus Thiodiazotropha sp.]|nr:beta-lactamase family protein [Candidatus Thiodiazotropha sp.]MCM8881762.1 beta-lactamase family protein [Candidatus Thiodiazotropha sp.]MCM8920373.1 beta-lactamase family protein [Candidatus Thiodiazotropha sp.]
MMQSKRFWSAALGQPLVAATLAISLLTGCNATNTTKATPNEQFQAALDDAVERGLPAVSVRILGRNIDYSGVAGSSDLESGEPVTLNNRFYVASIGKTFLAATLVQMAADGLLDLDDPIKVWLPDSITSRIPSSNQMSVRMLLNHTTGLYDFQNDGDEWDNVFLNSGPERQWKQADVLPFFLDKPLHFKPGTDYSYSNTNYVLAAMIVEVVTGDNVQAAIRNRVIEPLGLTHTLHGDEAIGIPGLVHGYYNDDGEKFDVYPWYNHYGLADAGIQTNAEDLANFLLGLLKSDLVVTDQMREEMLQASKLGNPSSTYGLGININPIPQNSDVIYTHSGKDPGYQANMLYVEGKDTVIVLCASGSFGDYDVLYQELLMAIFTLLEDLQND